MTTETAIYVASGAATSAGVLMIATADYASISTLVGSVGVLAGIVIGGVIQVIALRGKIAQEAKAAAELAATAAREQAAAIEKAAREQGQALAEISAKAKTIEHLVDGTSTRQIAEIKMLRELLEHERDSLVSEKATAVALANSTAAAGQVVADAQAKTVLDVAAIVAQAAGVGATTPPSVTKP